MSHFFTCLFIPMHSSLGRFSLGSAEADVGWGGKLNEKLRQEYSHQKFIKIWYSSFKL